MSIPDHLVDEAAQRLEEAATTRQACAPVRDLIGATTSPRRTPSRSGSPTAASPAGARVVGRKIGLTTSGRCRQQLGVDQPDFGVLFDDMAFADGDDVPMRPAAAAAGSRPRSPSCSSDDLAEGRPGRRRRSAAAVDYAVAALEIVDSRIADWDITFADTVADNASSGLYVLGTERRTAGRGRAGRRCTMTMTRRRRGGLHRHRRRLPRRPAATRWRGWPDQARDSASRCAPARSCSPARSARWSRSTPGAVVTATITGLGTVTARFADHRGRGGPS